ncbi:MAG: nucleotidyltransferase family protein [Betaproteobacteria bacterium]
MRVGTSTRSSDAPVIGILLAAGSASRFGGGKLMASLPRANPPTTLVAASLERLRAAVAGIVAVVREGDEALATMLRVAGVRVTVCPNAAEGIGASLAWGVRASPVAAGWVVALADMPWIGASSVAAVVEALRNGARIAAPRVDGVRGHPVGFSAACYGELSALRGDEGAKRMLSAHAASVQLIDVADRGVLLDIDTPADLMLIPLPTEEG